MAKIVWTPKALDDLESLLDYISKDAPAAARRFAQKLVSRVEMLGRHPLLGGFVIEDPEHVYRPVEKGCHCWLAQQCGEKHPGKHCWTSQQWHPNFGKAITVCSIAPTAGWCTL